jgi:hypothetical protein
MWPELRHSKPFLTILCELRCSQPVCLYAMNWDVQTPFTYAPLWTEALTTHLPILHKLRYSQPAYLHDLKLCLNPIHQHSSILRCEQYVDQYIPNWNVCNLFAYTLTEVFGTCWHASPVLRHVQPVSLHFLNWDVHNLLIRLPWNEMLAHCLPMLPEVRCLETAKRLAWTEISKACLLVTKVLQFTNIYTHEKSNHITWNL